MDLPVFLFFCAFFSYLICALVKVWVTTCFLMAFFVVIRVCNRNDMRKIVQKLSANYVKKDTNILDQLPSLQKYMLIGSTVKYIAKGTTEPRVKFFFSQSSCNALYNHN